MANLEPEDEVDGAVKDRDAEPEGVMFPILEPTGAQSPLSQVVRVALPTRENTVEG